MKHRMLYLVIGIPVAAIVMGIINVYIAMSNPDPGVDLDGRPLSKTSYRNPE